MARNRRNGVVKQLSNLSIDEVSLVDRGANQHALISIAKRAPEAADSFEKKDNNHAENFVDGVARTSIGAAAGGAGALLAAQHGAPHIARAATEVSRLASIHPNRVGAAGVVAGAATGLVVHHHYGNSTVNKALGDGPVDVNDLFDVSKKGGSFGRGGNTAGTDTFSGSDPSGVTKDPNGEDGNVGPDGKIDGVETIEGEDVPPQKKGKGKGGKGDINPSPLSGLGKSADYWTSVISKVLEDESDVSKHFPGGGGTAPVPGNPQDPTQSPFPGAAGAAQPPVMQTPGVQPMGMGQPTPPPGQPGMQQPQAGMPQQLPPDVVQYIQQLEQALDAANGGDDSGDQNQDDSGNQDPNKSDGKNNPFGKSGDFDMSNDLFLQELAKSLDSEDQREAVGKALEAVSKAEQRAIAAETIAKQERDLRLEREFIAKAAEFNTPVRPEDLGPVLKRLAESVTKDDFQVIVKCLNGASARDDIFAEVGKRGGGSNGSVLDEVNARATALSTGDISKSLSPEAAVAEVFEMDPRAYDAYLSEHPSRRISR